MKEHKKSKKNKAIKIYRAKIKSLIIFEVVEYELVILEYGEKHKSLGKWGSNTLSISLTLFVTWLTTDFENEFLHLIFLLFWFTGSFLGIVLILISKRDKKSTKTILDQIRQRHITKKSGRFNEN